MTPEEYKEEKILYDVYVFAIIWNARINVTDQGFF